MGPLLAAPLILGGAQTLAGIFTKAGKRPTYKIPGAARESLANARSMANQTVRPGNEVALKELNRNATNTIGTLRNYSNSAAQILGKATAVGTNLQRGIERNNALNAQFSYNAKQNLNSSLERFAAYQDKAFMENEMKPYMERVETKNALIGAGMQNIFGGLGNAVQMDMFNSIYGNQGGGTQASTSTTPSLQDQAWSFYNKNKGSLKKPGVTLFG